MFKPSDSKYFLPVIEALEAGSVFISGRTHPMKIRGVCQTTHEKGDYVVKCKGSPEMFNDGMLYELLGSFIAMELGFHVPDPAVINFSPEFVDSMHGHENFAPASQSLGFNFGSVLEDGFVLLLPGQAISLELKLQLVDLFAFDIFIGNADRRADKHNFLTDGTELLILDHEMAFGFTRILSFARNPSPWLIVDLDMEWISQNFCYQELKGNNWDFSNFGTRLSVISETFWKRVADLIPECWQSSHFQLIKSYLSSIVEHRDEFISELNRVLL